MIGGKGLGGLVQAKKGAPGKHKSFKSAFWGSLEKEKRRNKTNAKNSPFIWTWSSEMSMYKVTPTLMLL